MDIITIVADIVHTLIDAEPATFEIYRDKPWAQGSAQQRDRIEAVADYCAKRWDGDLIEIGAYYGATTMRLLKVARKYQRRVIAIDPWEIGTQNCEGPEYEGFLQNTSPWADILDIVRMSSLDEKAIRYVTERELCFAFIDGLHSHKSCYSDILTVGHSAGVIVVDDVLWDGNLLRALQDAAERLERQIFRHRFIREGYLLPC